jgi:GntR family transcriptional regulator/MocR family aminotransferase
VPLALPHASRCRIRPGPAIVASLGIQLLAGKDSYRKSSKAPPENAIVTGILLDRESAVSLWQQLYRQFRQAVIERRMMAGAKLPATRVLAQNLCCSRNTILSAFDQLIAEGYFKARRGSGIFVSQAFSRDTAPRDPFAAFPQSNLDLSRRGKAMTIAMPQQPEPYRAFAPSLPDISLFPFHAWDRISRIWRKPERALLMQSDPGGYWPLRESICTYLRTARMIECQPQDVIITTGAQNGVDIAARLLLDPGDAAWVEDPGYPGLRGALYAAGATVVPVPMDDNGLSLLDGIATGTMPRMIAVAPSHQYPLGTTMSLQRRLELLAYADKTGCWILEDDYDNEFRYAGRPPAALRSLDGGSRVIYVGTFSKVLFPSLRLGYLVGPSRIAERFTVGRTGLDFQPSILPQPIVDAFFREGLFLAHVRRMRSIYRNRQAALVEAAETYLANILSVQPDVSGIHLLGHFNPETRKRLSDVEASRRAEACRVIAPPLSSFYVDQRNCGALVLGYAAVDETIIVAAAQRLADALKT